MTKADQLAAALDDLLAVSPDVEAAAVVSADGLPMASALPPSVEEDRLAAMSAALLTLGERAASGLGKGNLGQVFVEGDYGHVVLMAAGENAVLVAVTSTLAKIGLVLFEMKAVAARIGQVMAGSAVTQQAPAHEPALDPLAPVQPMAPEYADPVGHWDAPAPAASPLGDLQVQTPQSPEPAPGRQERPQDESEVTSWQ